MADYYVKLKGEFADERSRYKVFKSLKASEDYQKDNKDNISDAWEVTSSGYFDDPNFKSFDSSLD